MSACESRKFATFSNFQQLPFELTFAQINTISQPRLQLASEMESTVAEGEPDPAMAPAPGASPTGGSAAGEPAYFSPKEIVAELTRRAKEHINSKTSGQGKAKTTGGGGLQGS